MNWYLIEVEKGQEEAAVERLNLYKEISAYYPKVQKHFRVHGEDSFGERALSSGCVLVETKLSIKQLSEYFNKQKQFSILSFQVLHEDEVEMIKRLCGKDWLMKMSRGVIVNGITQIKEGPLIGEEPHIKKINRHKRFCELDYELNNRSILAGLEITEKR